MMFSGKVAMEQLPFTWFAIYGQICASISRTTLSKQDWAAYSCTNCETIFSVLPQMIAVGIVKTDGK